MKYLVSAYQLGMLHEATKERRKEIIENIMNLQYVRETSDSNTLDDCININKGKKP